MRTLDDIKKIAALIKANFNVQKIILFGSYAYGTPTKDSDLDLMVVMQTDMWPPDQAAEIRYKLFKIKGSSGPMDLLVRTPEFLEKRLKIDDTFIRTIVERGIEL